MHGKRNKIDGGFRNLRGRIGRLYSNVKLKTVEDVEEIVKTLAPTHSLLMRREVEGGISPW